jgi:hypothetical protein
MNGNISEEENNTAPGNPIWSVHTDSWESHLHTWGTGFQEEFEKRRGYSMIPWLPALTTGAIVGTATYQTAFTLPSEIVNRKSPMFLDLGEVKEIAEVRLNGKPLGTLWKPPFKVDVSDALVEGENTLEIKVTNLWPNRLIGDEKLHPDPSLDTIKIGGIWGHGPQQTIPQWVRDGKQSPVGRTTWILNKFYDADSPLLPSGLLGPVRLLAQ